MNTGATETKKPRAVIAMLVGAVALVLLLAHGTMAGDVSSIGGEDDR